MIDARVLWLGVVVGLAGCTDAPPRQSLQGWILEEPFDVGPCRFSMQRAWLYHSSEFNIQMDLVVENIGQEPARCAFSLRAVTGSGKAITDAASGAVEVAPGELMELTASATEANLTGLSGSPADDAWIYARLTHGYWPIGDTRELHATPSRDRPPSPDAFNPQ